jgi:hypothetical protein|tara:strand:- start:7923 stop:8741 length:819 start_codon:yes stop_codon:yes gene_type:complete
MAKFLEKWKNRVEGYKDKAEEIQALIQEGADTIRDIRSDVESTVEDLKTDSEEKMMESLERIQDSERVFKEAGYLLHAVELEMGFNPKVVAVLKRESQISDRKKDRLLKQHEDDKIIKMILTSIFKAESLEDKVHLRRLSFSEVHLEMGLVPAIHVLWEDKTAGITTPSPVAISETSTEDSFTSSSSFASGSSPFASTTSVFSDEPVEDEPEEEIPAEPEPITEEKTTPQPVETEEVAPAAAAAESAPTPEPASKDPEDDKWIDFPDVSFTP